MNNIGHRIRRFREEKGFSQEYMALELEISQASYARLESQESRLDVQRLIRIAKILQVHFAQLIGEEPQNIFHQNNEKSNQVNGFVQNLYQESQETIQKLIDSKDETITKLEAEIIFLRKIVEKNI